MPKPGMRMRRTRDHAVPLVGLPRQVARRNVAIKGPLPGLFLADRLRSGRADAAAKACMQVGAAILGRMHDAPAGGRLERVLARGSLPLLLCTTSSGLTVGRNLLRDGGACHPTLG